MGEIVNLRRVRRRMERAGDAQAAAENRARHGRTRGEAAAEALADRQAGRMLDGARIERPDQAPEGRPVAKRAKDSDTAS